LLNKFILLIYTTEMSLLEKSSSVELSRRTQPFYAKQQSYALGRQVQIEVDTQREFLDFENARLVFDLVFTQNTDAYTPNPWTASATIQNLRVKTLSGQMIGHEIREYRAWMRVKKELTSSEESKVSYNQVLEGATSPSIDKSFTQEYAHKLDEHIFSVKEYYPAHFHQGIMIEYDLPATVNEIAINTDSTTAANLPDLTVDNIKFVCDLVQVKPELENEMVRMMEEQKLFVDYEEVLTQQNTIAAASGLQAFDLVGIDGRVKSAFTILIADADRDSIQDDDLGTWARNDLGSYRYKLGSHYLNYQSIPCGEATGSSQRAEQVFELLKALDLHAGNKYENKGGAGLNGIVVYASDLGDLELTRFAIGVKVDRAQSNTSESISSMVDKDRNNMRVELNFDASPGAGQSYTFVKLDKRLQMLPGSVVRNVRS
jgi:hypothetical protein